MSETLYTYKWNDGITKETYWDSSKPTTYKVPYYSVDFEDDPSHFSRTVIERDLQYKEPVTVAMEPTDSQRSKMFICNKRLSFLAGPNSTGGLVLKPTGRSLQLLRNGVFWCLDMDKDLMLRFNTDPEAEAEPYDSSSRVDNSNTDYSLLSMSSNQVSGKSNVVDQLIECLPNGELVIPANFLLSTLTGSITVQNATVPVYVRYVSGVETPRVEFGQYSYTDFRDPSKSYTSPGYNEDTGPTGIIAETSSATYDFWNSLWDNSVKTGKYLSDLLDTRITPVGIPQEADIATEVNPLRFILSHILSTGIIFLVVKSKPSLGETAAEALLVSEEEVNSIPWDQVNKLLPTSTNYIILYTS